MTPLEARALLLLGAALLGWLAVMLVRRYAQARRRAVLAAPPVAGDAPTAALSLGATRAPVRILAFSSADCSPCHTLQAPALARVRAARGERVAVVEVDAPSAPDLTARYAVLTVPTTVVLDAHGQAHALNYGFATTQKLLQQVDALLAAQADPAQAAAAG